MHTINEQLLLLMMIGSISVALILCIVGIAAPGWAGFNIFDIRIPEMAGLSVVSLIFLLLCLITAILILTRIIKASEISLVLIVGLILAFIFPG